MRPLSLLLILLIMLPAALGAVVTRKMPSTVEPGSSFEVKFRILSAQENQTFTLEETRPLQVEIIDWQIAGAKEEKDKIETRQKDLGYGWSFTPVSNEATITYTAKVSPQATGDLAFEAVYFDSGGFNRLLGMLNVARSQPKVNEEPIQSALKEEGVNESGNGATDSAKQKGKGSILLGVIITLGIIIAGLAIFLYITRPKKRREYFNDSFFKK